MSGTVAERLAARPVRERGPAVGRHLADAGQRPVADAVREDRREPRLLRPREHDAVVVGAREVERLQLTLEDVFCLRGRRRPGAATA